MGDIYNNYMEKTCVNEGAHPKHLWLGYGRLYHCPGIVNRAYIDVKDPQGNVVGEGRINGMVISVRLDDSYLFEKLNEGVCSSVSIGGGELNLIEHPHG